MMAEQVIPDPRRSVLRLLATRADHFAEMEQVFVAEGKYAEAEGAHQFGLWCLRSYRAEADDPDPEPLDG